MNPVPVGGIFQYGMNIEIDVRDTCHVQQTIVFTMVATPQYHRVPAI